MLWTSLPVQTLALATLSLAAPLDKPTNSNPPSSPYVVLALCVPFLLLASAKLVYLKYRRARTIHSYDTVVASASNDCKESQDPWSGLGIIASISRSSLQRDCSSQECSDSGYLVGCFGSPHWETRIVSRAGKCTRQTISLFSGRTGRNITAPPATYTSRPARRPTAIAQSRQYSTISSKAASVSFLEMQSPQLDITICGNVHPSSPPCDDNFNGVPLLTEPKRATKFKGKCSPNLSPVTVHIEQTRISVFDEPLCANYEGILPYSRTPSFKHANLSDESSGTMSSMRSECTMANSVFPDRIIVLPPDTTSGTLPRSLDDKEYPIVPGPLVVDASIDRSFVPETLANPPSTVLKTNKPRERTTTEKRQVTDCTRVHVGSVLCIDSLETIPDSWVLDDLLKDGQLDLDAVNDVLCLAPSVRTHNASPALASSKPQTDWEASQDPEALGVRIRLPGGPLCVIPEESEDIAEITQAGFTPLIGLWEAACRLDPILEEALPTMKSYPPGRYL